MLISAGTYRPPCFLCILSVLSFHVLCVLYITPLAVVCWFEMTEGFITCSSAHLVAVQDLFFSVCRLTNLSCPLWKNAFWLWIGALLPYNHFPAHSFHLPQSFALSWCDSAHHRRRADITVSDVNISSHVAWSTSHVPEGTRRSETTCFKEEKWILILDPNCFKSRTFLVRGQGVGSTASRSVVKIICSDSTIYDVQHLQCCSRICGLMFHQHV